MITTPDELEEAAITLLGDKLVWHIAGFERQRGLPARRIVPPATIDLLADGEHRLERDVLPAVLLSIAAKDGEATPGQDGYETYLSIPWQLEIEIVAFGGGKSPQADAMLRIRWYALLVAECLLQRYTTTVDAVESIDLTGNVDFEVQVDSGAALGRASMSMTVVARTLTLGGAPALSEDGDPYDDGPDVWPDVTQQPVDVDRRPITENLT